MSQEQNQGPQGTLVNVKRVREDVDSKGRRKVVLTFGLDKDGNNGLDKLINTLTELQGKQANFDIRLEEKTSDKGTKFMTAFVIVKEMIPREAGQTQFVPKNTTRANTARANAAKVRSAIE
jgi:hypothetical protein